MGYTEFESKFINDFSKFENIKIKIPILKKALYEAAMNELPRRDHRMLFQIRDFTNSTEMKINHNSQFLACRYSDEKNCLLVGTLAPNWRFGWKNISKDPFVSEQISNFFYFTNQYICRGYQINLIGAIALTYGKYCDFRGATIHEFQLPRCNSEYTDFITNIPRVKTKKNCIIERYLKIINSFDPYVNKMLYYYFRMISLFNHGYDEEVLINADNVIDTICQAIKKYKEIPTMSRKNMLPILQEELKISKRTTIQLENLYLLRCGFSAHPAHSKWWDFSELYGEEIDGIMDEIKVVIIKFLMFESNHRKVEKSPVRWSEWFLNNCETVYDAVWFNKLPKLNI